MPIGSVTNGVHTPTWVAPEILALLAGGTTPQTPPVLGGPIPPDPPWGGYAPPHTPRGLGPGRGRPGR